MDDETKAHHGRDGEGGKSRHDPVGGSEAHDDEGEEQGQKDTLESLPDDLLLLICRKTLPRGRGIGVFVWCHACLLGQLTMCRTEG